MKQPTTEQLAAVLLAKMIRRQEELRRKPKLSASELVELKALNKKPLDKILR